MDEARVICESKHRHADRLAGELQLCKKQAVATPMVKEPRKARKRTTNSNSDDSNGQKY